MYKINYRMPKQIQNKKNKTKKARGRPKTINCDDDANEFIEPNNNSSLVIKMEWNKHIIEL